MLAGTWITLLSLSGVGAAASRRAASPSSLAFLDLDEFDPVAAVKGIPGAVRDNLRIFRAGTGAMWRNRKAASVVRKRVKQGGAAASYSELLLLPGGTQPAPQPPKPPVPSLSCGRPVSQAHPSHPLSQLSASPS